MTGQREDDHAARIIAGVPEGLDALVLAQLVNEAQSGSAPGALLHVARDDRRLEALEQALSFFAPQVRVITFPAWDTVPYDRIGPHTDIVARRMATLAKLALATRKHPTIVLTTVNAILQRVPARSFMKRTIKPLAPGQRIDMAHLTQRLALMGYTRSGTVMDQGEYAVRGGILDLYPPGRSTPVRLDFFGDTLETIKAFDVQTQRTTKPVQKLALLPVSEVAFGEEAEKLFRMRYVELFGGATSDDPLYEAVSSGHRYPGQEHWLPLFHDHLETLFDYLPGVPVSFDHRSDELAKSRFEQIAEHYQSRNEALEEHKFGGPPYKPVPPERMFLDPQSFAARAGRPALLPPDTVRGRRRPQRALLARTRRAHLRGRTTTGRCQRVRRRRRPHPAPAKRAAARYRHRLDARRARAPRNAAHGPRPQGRDARRILRRGLGAARYGDSHRRARHRARLRDAGDRRHRRAGHPRRPPRAPAAQAALSQSTC